MFAFLTMQFPSGLALYWVISNVITIVIQYYMTGWGALAPAAGKSAGRDKKYVKRITLVEKKEPDYADVGADIAESDSAQRTGKTGYTIIKRHQAKGKQHKRR